MEGMAIFTGNSNPALAKKICDYLSLPLGGAKVKTFSDGEIQIEIHRKCPPERCFRGAVNLFAGQRQSG